MKKILILATSIITLLLASSCQKTVVHVSQKNGFLSFGDISLEIDETVDKKATAAGGFYTIRIIDENGVEHFCQPYSTIKNNGDKVSLPAGSYTLFASSSDEAAPIAAFEQPVYGTEYDFTIAAGMTTTIDEPLVCTLVQCKVTVSYSDEFLEAVTGAGVTKVEVTSGYPLSFELNADGSYDPNAGYFALNGGNTMLVEFKGLIDGKNQTMRKTITGIAPKQWRQIKFVQKKNEQGNAFFDIEIQDLIGDATLNNVIDAVEDVIGVDPAAPKGDGGITLLPNYDASEAEKNVFEVTYKKDADGDFILDDNGEKKVEALSIRITEPYLTDGDGNLIADMLIKLRAIVPEGVKKFEIDITTDNGSFANAVDAAEATHLNLISPSAANMIIFQVVPFPYGAELLGGTDIPFDLSNAQTAIYTYKGTHTFTMTIVDNKNQKNVIPVTMVVE